ncbi:hypothetical protein T36_0536 [Helicobacter cinaedi]|uniref:YopX family protein n=1 Tax=Helicobacter cinaedi TaxID=213 RepID=UPI001F3B25D0|nr:YopX family protein [Helicobacter cinaedi]BDB64089.1 hypothetical protein T36_0536 [Helicobacter cinaedi]
MKLADFDFRIWDNREQCYLNENYLENSPFQAMGLVKAHKSSFFGHNFDKVALFSAGEDKECGFGWNSGDDDDSYELELWSGIRDKNGKKIYEGDVVLIQENKEAEFFPLYLDDKHRKRDIKFLISQPFIIKLTELEPFVFDAYDITTQGIAYPLEKIRDFVFEVVGNIHENPALLQTSQNE